MSDEEEYTPTVEDWVEGQAGSVEGDAITIVQAKGHCEAVAFAFSTYPRKDGVAVEYYQREDWPPAEFVELCRQVAEFEIPAPPKGSE